MKKVGIILINYKDYAERFLQECRDSLRLQTYSAEDFKVYLVDNASSQESIEYLKNNYQEAIIIPRDDGNYCAGNNAGIKRALSDGAEIIVIANMDMAFDENWLKELIIGLESAKEVGIVQAKILLYPKSGEPAKINSLGNSLHFLGFGFCSSYQAFDSDIFGYPEIAGYASGSSLAIKKEVLNIIGGYNEEYFMYHDDLEVSWKTKLAGYKIILAPKARCFHKYEFSRSVKKIYDMERNRFRFILNFYEIKTILLILPALIIMEFGQILFAILNGWLAEKIKVYTYFLKIKNWQNILAERKIIQKNRIKKDSELVDGMVGEIFYQEINNPLLKYLANPFFNVYWRLVKRIIKS